MKQNHSDCSRISNTLNFLFLNKMLFIRLGFTIAVGYQAWVHKKLVRIAIREDPYQTASSGFALFVWTFLG